MKVDYRKHYYDVITNPIWQTAANKKSSCWRITVNSDPIIMTFGTLNQIVTKVK